MLNLAFIGGGINSAVGRVHQIALAMDDKFRLVAGCFSEDGSVRAETAKAYGVTEERSYATVPAMIAAETGEVDAFVVLTPTNLHLDAIVCCLRAGTPVISEKALVADLAQLADLESEYSNRECPLIVTYNYTGYPMVREARSMIQSGAIGRVNRILAEMPQEGFLKASDDAPAMPQKWRLKDGDIPTISLDLGVHLHHMIRFLMGEIAPVRALGVQNSFGRFPGLIDDVQANVVYENAAVASFWYSKSALGHSNGLRIRVYGERGALDWYQLNPESLGYTDEYGVNHMISRADPNLHVASQDRYSRFKAGHPAGFIEAFANLYSDIHDVLSDIDVPDSGQYVSGITHSAEGLRLMNAIALSSESNSWVEL